VIETWYNTWNYVLFQAGGKAWTLNQQFEWAKENTCDCTPDMVEEALKTPIEMGGPNAIIQGGDGPVYYDERDIRKARV
jgi:predicted FMN-binding regulatory protein PaiB